MGMVSSMVSARVGDVDVTRIAPILGDDQRAVANTGVENEEPAIGQILRMEGKAQQPAFAARENAGADVGKSVGTDAPDCSTLMMPACSTMKRRLVPSPACPTKIGLDKPLTYV